MSLLPPEATFAEVVQEAFLQLHGKGLMLGALDHELLRAWSETGVPAEVVLRGLEAAAARAAWDAPAGAKGPRSQRAGRPEVEADIFGYQARVLGAGAKAREGAGQLAQELRALARSRPRFAKVVEQLWAAGVLARANPRDAVVAALVREMPFEERLTLLRVERRQMVEEASPRARSMLRRRVRAAFAASEFGLKAL
ncbi:MAG: hypothetical protein ACLPJH_18465 [Myxococcaceae bacterium]